MIYQEVDKVPGRNYAVIVDEAHSSQTGSSAMKLKAALADTEEALREYAELEGKAEEELDPNNKLLQEMITQGKHANLSFFAFTATPKAQTLELFGTEYEDGSFHPFHVYSMRQAIEEGFILDVLQNYMTYDTCFKIAKSTPENPEPRDETHSEIRAAAPVQHYAEGADHRGDLPRDHTPQNRRSRQNDGCNGFTSRCRAVFPCREEVHRRPALFGS